MRLLWVVGGLISMAIGVIGIALPLLPTVPLFLLAAFCFARSSERLHNWLLSHPKFGPPIGDWQSTGAISRRGKQLATLSVGLAFGLSVALGVANYILIIQGIVLTAVLIFLWTRPNA